MYSTTSISSSLYLILCFGIASIILILTFRFYIRKIDLSISLGFILIALTSIEIGLIKINSLFNGVWFSQPIGWLPVSTLILSVLLLFIGGYRNSNGNAEIRRGILISSIIIIMGLLIILSVLFL